MARAVTYHLKAQAEVAAGISKVCIWASAGRRLAEEEPQQLLLIQPRLVVVPEEGRSAKAVIYHRKAQAEVAAETSKVSTWASEVHQVVDLHPL